MKKVKILIILYIMVMVFLCCSTETKETKELYIPQKPFIIHDKGGQYTKKQYNGIIYCRYYYYDAKGTIFYFYDKDEKYSIGDTLK